MGNGLHDVFADGSLMLNQVFRKLRVYSRRNVLESLVL